MKINVMKNVAVIASGIALSVFALETKPAEAAGFYTFDFSGQGGTQPSFLFEVDDLSVTATGADTDGDGLVRQVGKGLGIFDPNPNTKNRIDGFDSLESLFLTFNQTVQIVSATFGGVDGNDNFTLRIDGNTQFENEDIPDDDMFDFSSFDMAKTIGDVFEFTVLGKTDNYNLKGVTVALAPTSVPEPVSIFGFLATAALGAAGLKRQQQSKA